MHPAIKILSLMICAIALQMAHWRGLGVMSLIIFMALLYFGTSGTLVLLKRARWLFLSILLIYAFATPGEYVAGFPDNLAPTYEGITSGLMQVLRLATMLGALSLVLATSNREQFMSGIYFLLRPFRLLGISPERFSARLWLTLHYVETMPKGIVQHLKQQGWNLDELLNAEQSAPETVTLQCTPLHIRDLLVLALWLPVLWSLS
jgi:energy-coupling factor transporter transmembrane protein EcfT